MQWSRQRATLRAILSGKVCIRPASVWDAVSARIAEDIGYEFGILGGSTASLTVLGDPDLMLITLSELTETVRRITRAGKLPVMVDADHGFGNALNVRRTIEEMETAGAAGVTIEDTLLPQAFGQAKPQLIPIEEGIGKMKAAVDARIDPALVIFARTTLAVNGLEDAIKRAQAYEATGVDVLFMTGVKTRDELAAIASATKLPIMLGQVDGEVADDALLNAHRVRICGQGHLPFMAAAQAIHETLKGLREGKSRKDLKGLPSSEFVDRYMRNADVQRRSTEFLGLKR
ncbi:oxaloacetate decarboxylase [Afipia sp. P52-10]|jgi:carboxyvinyl-carboxyphosphonate phosphorylmutase|uniref:isocitrate lyase/PEP mutase family protein n=1 Tax=Afipia sp. P52-10 TaxID=1429916 RepID=UPI0003DF16A5|nr:isocitrate lyase/PEP mutase family protein [Afipia sp. P52-10]ETR75508.1 oxaloacetate decarboxylase [Afipia sp. P52-10]